MPPISRIDNNFISVIFIPDEALTMLCSFVSVKSVEIPQRSRLTENVDLLTLAVSVGCSVTLYKGFHLNLETCPSDSIFHEFYSMYVYIRILMVYLGIFFKMHFYPTTHNYGPGLTFVGNS